MSHYADKGRVEEVIPILVTSVEHGAAEPCRHRGTKKCFLRAWRPGNAPIVPAVSGTARTSDIRPDPGRSTRRPGLRVLPSADFRHHPHRRDHLTRDRTAPRIDSRPGLSLISDRSWHSEMRAISAGMSVVLRNSAPLFDGLTIGCINSAVRRSLLPGCERCPQARAKRSSGRVARLGVMRHDLRHKADSGIRLSELVFPGLHQPGG